MPNTSSRPPPPPPPPHPLQNGKYPPRACAACKHQRKKCADTCMFAPYFPPGLAREFEQAQKVFGVSNMVKMAGKIPVAQRRAFFESLVCEAEERYANPVTGSAGQLERLRKQNLELRGEIEVLRERLRLYEKLSPSSNSSSNYNGFVDYNVIQHQSNGDLCDNGLHGLSNGIGLGFPSNGMLIYNGGSLLYKNGGAALPNGERGRRS